MKLKVVFDTNIYISAIIFGGNPRVCLDLARERKLSLFASRPLLLEIAGVLYKKFKWSNGEVREVIQGIAYFAELVMPREQLFLIKEDPPDNRVLEAAKEVNADFIVSGDQRHILIRKSFAGIPIVSAAEFIRLFKNQ